MSFATWVRLFTMSAELFENCHFLILYRLRAQSISAVRFCNFGTRAWSSSTIFLFQIIDLVRAQSISAARRYNFGAPALACRHVKFAISGRWFGHFARYPDIHTYIGTYMPTCITYAHLLHTHIPYTHYIHTVHTYINTYMHAYIHTYIAYIRYIRTLHTYMHTYITYVHTYIGYIHTYITLH